MSRIARPVPAGHPEKIATSSFFTDSSATLRQRSVSNGGIASRRSSIWYERASRAGSARRQRNPPHQAGWMGIGRPDVLRRKQSDAIATDATSAFDHLIFQPSARRDCREQASRALHWHGHGKIHACM